MRFFVLAVFLFLVGQVTNRVAAMPDVQVTTVVNSQNGKTIPVQAGAVIVVALGSNPSTGFSWSPSKSNPTNIKSLGSANVPSASGSNRPGTPGAQVFTMQVTGQGKATIMFLYSRPWEKSKQPGQIFSVTLDIKPR